LGNSGNGKVEKLPGKKSSNTPVLQYSMAIRGVLRTNFKRLKAMKKSKDPYLYVLTHRHQTLREAATSIVKRVEK